MNTKIVTSTGGIPCPGLSKEEVKELILQMLTSSGGYLTERSIRDEMDRRFGKYANCGMQIDWRLQELQEAGVLTYKWDWQFRVYHVRLNSN